MNRTLFFKLASASSILLFLASNSVGALDERTFGFTEEGFSYEIIGDTITIGMGHYEDKTQVVIPETIEGKTVTSIADQAFVWEDEITSLTIPETVERIGRSAFAKCSKLEYLKIPDKVTIIQSSTFHDCEALTKIDLPKGLSEIGNSAFENCRSLTDIELPEGLKLIGNNAFVNCRSLTHIELPEGLETIGSYAFTDCKSLESISIPAVSSISSHAFKGCSSLETVEIAEGVTSIDTYAFAECLSLSEIVIPKSVEKIAENAFVASPSNMVIKGDPDSFAEGYANAKGIAFEISEAAAEELEKTALEQRALLVTVIVVWSAELLVIASALVFVAKNHKMEKKEEQNT